MIETKYELKEATESAYATGLNIYSLIGKYKKVCRISRLEDQVIIDTCNSYMKYRAGIKGSHWAYFVRILHTKYQTFKPEDLGERGGGMMGINSILAAIMSKG